MSPRSGVLYGCVLLASLALWVLLALASVQGPAGLLALDPQPIRALSLWEPPAFSFGQAQRRSLLWFGDSVSTVIRAKDPVDAATPPLMALVNGALATRAAGSGWGLEFEAFQQSGARAFQFRQYALCLQDHGRYPDVAVLGVNLRSLNRLGQNGFYGSASDPLRPWKAHERSWPQQGAAWARAFAAWNRALIGGLFTPPGAPVGAAPTAASARVPLPPATPEPVVTPAPQAVGAPMGPAEGYARVYGQGYALDDAAAQALIDAGRALRSGGSQALFYLTPIDRAGLRDHAGPGTLADLDAAAGALCGRLRAEGFTVLDLHGALHQGFIEPPSEHLGAEGRRQLGALLVPWLASALEGGRGR